MPELFFVGYHDIRTVLKNLLNGIPGHVFCRCSLHTLHFRRQSDCTAEMIEGFCMDFRHTLAGAVTAQGGGGEIGSVA